MQGVSMGTTYGAFGPDVRAIQDRLDAASGTRRPRLRGDSQFGPLTMGRVMEFQFQEGLNPDGDVGPATASRLAEGSGNNDLPSGRCILVDLVNDRLRAFDNGLTKLDFRTIKGGARSDPSTRGVFKVFKRLRHHTSSKSPFRRETWIFLSFTTARRPSIKVPPQYRLMEHSR
jgi:Putative peptidoglycan binding domain